MRFRRKNIPRSKAWKLSRDIPSSLFQLLTIPPNLTAQAQPFRRLFFFFFWGFEVFLNTRHEYMIFPFAQHSEPHRWTSMSMATFLLAEGEAAKHHHIKPVSLPARASWHDVKKANLILTIQPRKARAPPFLPPRSAISYLSALFAFAPGGDHHTPTEEVLEGYRRDQLSKNNDKQTPEPLSTSRVLGVVRINSPILDPLPQDQNLGKQGVEGPTRWQYPQGRGISQPVLSSDALSTNIYPYNLTRIYIIAHPIILPVLSNIPTHHQPTTLSTV